MDKYQNTLALVIKKRAIKELDVQVTLLTPNSGKLNVRALGAASIKSSRLSSLQLGNIIKAHLYHKNDSYWLSEAQTVESFLNQKKGLVQLNLLFYFLEILNRLIADDQQIEGIFVISQNVVKAINANNFSDFIKYEIQFINQLGYGLPEDISRFYLQKDYKSTQKHIKQFFESIIEKPLESNKLFK
jgi:DNA repair protein RecO